MQQQLTHIQCTAIITTTNQIRDTMGTIGEAFTNQTHGQKLTPYLNGKMSFSTYVLHIATYHRSMDIAKGGVCVATGSTLV